ncbi:flagellar hook-length control protein FliK [Caballeronia humi]|uniref:Flagellar hook-length control protein n=1 Tax=Caballeronia humi TaxID=326474 RepID=A0A158J2M5_9BURK|nr:flagellar hook-length control protein FliK [Caballeronia humi]SAL63098.1 flagellar hook-length control protein [Caballeronia humi]
MSSVSFGKALIGATSPVAKGKAVSSSRDEGAFASFGVTLQSMADKANAEAQAKVAASAAKLAAPHTSVHDAPQPSAPDASDDTDETTAAADKSDQSGKTDAPKPSADADADAGSTKDAAQPTTQADAKAAVAKAAADAAAAALAKARAGAADGTDAALADLASAAQSLSGADAATDASATGETDAKPDAHKATDAAQASQTPQDALQAALAAMNSKTPVQAPTGSGSGSPDAGTAANTGNADAGKAKRTVGLGDTLGDGKNTKSQATDAAALTNAQPIPVSMPPDDSTTAYKQTADAALHASALQAASANSGTSGAQGTMAAATSAAIAPHVGSSAWDDAFSQKVVFLSNAHQQSAELTLNPKDLGPLQVTLQVNDNHAHALFVSQHAQVREAVEAALPKLREAMEANGISLGSTSVNDGFARQSGQSGQQGGRESGRGGRDGGGVAGVDDSGGTTAVNMPTRRTVGLVDTFA